MRRRHSMVSSVFLILLVASSASGDDYSSPRVETYESPEIDLISTLRLDIDSYRYLGSTSSGWLSEVTMRRLPPGSVNYKLEGIHRLAARHARSQYRRFVRQAVQRGWYVRPDPDFSEPLFNNRAERDFDGGFNNGVWWQRSWMDSLLPDKGGAPAEPETYTIGSDTAWRWGPLTITNQLNVQFNYIAFFELNPNPVETQGDRPARRATLDISPASDDHEDLTNFRFDVKPRIRVGVPRDGDWRSILRELSVRGSVDIRHRGVSVIRGEFELSWNPQDGVEATFELALVRW